MIPRTKHDLTFQSSLKTFKTGKVFRLRVAPSQPTRDLNSVTRHVALHRTIYMTTILTFSTSLPSTFRLRALVSFLLLFCLLATIFRSTYVSAQNNWRQPDEKGFFFVSLVALHLMLRLFSCFPLLLLPVRGRLLELINNNARTEPTTVKRSLESSSRFASLISTFSLLPIAESRGKSI